MSCSPPVRSLAPADYGGTGGSVLAGCWGRACAATCRSVWSAYLSTRRPRWLAIAGSGRIGLTLLLRAQRTGAATDTVGIDAAREVGRWLTAATRRRQHTAVARGRTLAATLPGKWVLTTRSQAGAGSSCIRVTLLSGHRTDAAADTGGGIEAARRRGLATALPRGIQAALVGGVRTGASAGARRLIHAAPRRWRILTCTLRRGGSFYDLGRTHLTRLAKATTQSGAVRFPSTRRLGCASAGLFLPIELARLCG